jgi:type III secretion protein Q
MTREPVTELSESTLLPRLDASLQRALNRVHDDSVPLRFSCGGTDGELRLTYYKTPLPGLVMWARHRFMLGSHAGVLCMDGVGLSQLLRERRAELLPAQLRTVLLADALQHVVHALEESTRLRFEWTPGDAPDLSAREDAIGFEWRGRDGALLRGLAAFDDARSLEAVLPAFTRRSRIQSPLLDKLRMPLRFEVGSTTLPLAEVRGIVPGDVIGIERWTSAGAALHVSTRVGGLHGMRLAGRADGTRITIDSIGETPMHTDELSATGLSEADAAGLPLTRLDALEVVLRFEVGELSVSLGELRNLRPGHVFDLEQALNRSTVRILAHGNVLGKGSLVAVGERLGVRVSDFALGAL